MGKEYWVQRDGKMSGPFSGQQLKQLVASGMIGESDQISVDKANWEAAGAVGGLFPGPQATESESGDVTDREQGPTTADEGGIADVPHTGPGADCPEPHSEPETVPEAPDDRWPFAARLLVWIVTFAGTIAAIPLVMRGMWARRVCDHVHGRHFSGGGR